MHSPRARRQPWRRGISLLFLCGCAQATSGPAQPSDEQVTGTELRGPSLSVAANDRSTLAPVDATPSPDGKRIYYLAVANDGSDQPSAGVYAVDADAQGAGEIEELTLGAPLLTPLGIHSSLDGSALFIADTSAGADGTGALFRLPVAGGEASVVPGSEGLRPAGLVVGKQRGVEVLYFSGRDPTNGAGALFKIASAGGEAQRVAAFDADSEPGGVALAKNGDVYVADHAGANARVLRVRKDKVSVHVSDIALGFPAGVALTSDDKTLLVSGLDVVTKHDVVYAVNIGNGRLSRFTDGIDKFSESAGLHRAHNVDVFAWADSQANGAGTVYTVKF
jgi:sugar lactone lactonase YvrE